MTGELNRIRDEEVSGHGLLAAKGALADGLFQVRHLDGYALTRSIALEWLRCRNHDQSALYGQRIPAVSKEDALNAARDLRMRRRNLPIRCAGGNLRL